MSFSSIPVLDISLSRSPKTKPQFLEDLRRALFIVGFFYIKNTGIPDTLVDAVKRECVEFFELPTEEKDKLLMRNSPHFLGYSRLAAETTAKRIDQREQLDLGTKTPAPYDWEPRYRKLRGPSQWPPTALRPKFRETYEEYMSYMTDLATEFVSLIAEALDLPVDAFDQYYNGTVEEGWPELEREERAKRQDKLKIVKYPDLKELGLEGEGQGVGPHKDSMLTSYLLQVSPHRGLQVQNRGGEWVDAPPIDGTLVVAIGQGLEAMTKGICKSTTHRVLSPKAGEGARYSVPFFQGVSYDATFATMEIPEQVFELKRKILEDSGVSAAQAGQEVEFTFTKDAFERLGEATLFNRVKSHPDVGEKWYPDLFEIAKSKGLLGEAY